MLLPPICCHILQQRPYKKLFVFLGELSLVQTLTASAVKPSSSLLDIGLPTIATPTNSSLYEAPIANFAPLTGLLCLWKL